MGEVAADSLEFEALRSTSDDYFDAVEPGPNRGAAAVVVDNDGATAAVACPVEQPLSPPPTTTPKRTPAYRKMFPHKVALGVDRFAKTAMFHLPARYKHPVMLSSGAYGMVISAIDTMDNDTPVAIKRISQPWGIHGAARKSGPDDADAIRHAELAYREIRVLKFLKESWRDSCLASGVPEDEIDGNQQFNLVAMRDCFLAETTATTADVTPALDVYLVLEHCGSAADQFFVQNAAVGPMSLPVVKDLAFQFLLALQYMHSADIIHRDLKPQNLAIRKYPATAESGEYLDLNILDFGLSRQVQCEAMLYTDMDVVTREYRAPEVHFRRGEAREYGPAIDMWAFGVILAEMLSSCNEKSPTWSMFQTRASDNYLNVFSKIVSAIGVPPGDFSKSLDEASQTWLHQSFGASKTQKLRDFLREPLGNVPFFSGEKGKSDLDEAIDLIDSILKYDPNARLTAEQALHHPFFRDYQNGASFDPGVWGKIKSSTKLNISVGTLNADEWKEHVLEEVEDFITRFPPPSAEQNSLIP